MKTTGGLNNAARLLIGLSLLLAGCFHSTRPAQFYVLNAMTAASAGARGGIADNRALAVGPAQIPDTARRPQIVTRVGANRLEVSEYHRWGGSLEREVTRVVAENLGILLGTDRVAAYPWEAGFNPALRVNLDIGRLDGRLGREAVLHAVWTVWSGETGQTVLAGGKTVCTEAVSQGGYEALVAAYSRLLEALSREIAAAIAASP